MAAAVLAAFAVQDCAWAGASGSASYGPAAIPIISLPDVVKDPSRIPVPAGKMILREWSAGTNGKLIIHIQDAHGNYPAQKHLSEALAFWMDRFPGMRLVAVEGGEGDGSLDAMRQAAPRELWRRAAAQLLRDGLIAGEEFLNLTTERPMRIVGVEDQTLYDADRAAYARIAAVRPEITPSLHRIRTAIDALKARMYPQAALDYESGMSGSDGWDFVRRSVVIERLPAAIKSAAMGGSDHPAWDRWERLRAQESGSEDRVLEAEQAAVLASLPVNHPAVIELRAGAGKDPASAVGLWAAVEQAAAVKPGPLLRRYLDRLKEATLIDPEQLTREADAIDQTIYRTLLTDPAAARLRELDRYLGLLEKAVLLRLDGAQMNSLRSGMRAFPSRHALAWLNRQLADRGLEASWVAYEPRIDAALRFVRKFYDLASRRDTAFIDRLEVSMKDSADSAAFLIAGGYHSSHVIEMLKARGYSTAVFASSTDQETDWVTYERNLLGKRPSALARSSTRQSHIRQPFFAAAYGARLAGNLRGVLQELVPYLKNIKPVSPVTSQSMQKTYSETTAARMATNERSNDVNVGEGAHEALTQLMRLDLLREETRGVRPDLRDALRAPETRTIAATKWPSAQKILRAIEQESIKLARGYEYIGHGVRYVVFSNPAFTNVAFKVLKDGIPRRIFYQAWLNYVLILKLNPAIRTMNPVLLAENSKWPAAPIPEVAPYAFVGGPGSEMIIQERIGGRAGDYETDKQALNEVRTRLANIGVKWRDNDTPNYRIRSGGSGEVMIIDTGDQEFAVTEEAKKQLIDAVELPRDYVPPDTAVIDAALHKVMIPGEYQYIFADTASRDSGTRPVALEPIVQELKAIAVFYDALSTRRLSPDQAAEEYLKYMRWYRARAASGAAALAARMAKSGNRGVSNTISAAYWLLRWPALAYGAVGAAHVSKELFIATVASWTALCLWISTVLEKRLPSSLSVRSRSVVKVIGESIGFIALIRALSGSRMAQSAEYRLEKRSERVRAAVEALWDDADPRMRKAFGSFYGTPGFGELLSKAGLYQMLLSGAKTTPERAAEYNGQFEDVKAQILASYELARIFGPGSSAVIGLEIKVPLPDHGETAEIDLLLKINGPNSWDLTPGLYFVEIKRPREQTAVTLGAVPQPSAGYARFLRHRKQEGRHLVAARALKSGPQPVNVQGSIQLTIEEQIGAHGMPEALRREKTIPRYSAKLAAMPSAVHDLSSAVVPSRPTEADMVRFAQEDARMDLVLSAHPDLFFDPAEAGARMAAGSRRQEMVKASLLAGAVGAFLSVFGGVSALVYLPTVVMALVAVMRWKSSNRVRRAVLVAATVVSAGASIMTAVMYKRSLEKKHPAVTVSGPEAKVLQKNLTPGAPITFHSTDAYGPVAEKWLDRLMAMNPDGLRIAAETMLDAFYPNLEAKDKQRILMRLLAEEIGIASAESGMTRGFEQLHGPAVTELQMEPPTIVDALRRVLYLGEKSQERYLRILELLDPETLSDIYDLMERLAEQPANGPILQADVAVIRDLFKRDLSSAQVIFNFYLIQKLIHIRETLGLDKPTLLHYLGGQTAPTTAETTDLYWKAHAPGESQFARTQLKMLVAMELLAAATGMPFEVPGTTETLDPGSEDFRALFSSTLGLYPRFEKIFENIQSARNLIRLPQNWLNNEPRWDRIEEHLKQARLAAEALAALPAHPILQEMVFEAIGSVDLHEAALKGIRETGALPPTIIGLPAIERREFERLVKKFPSAKSGSAHPAKPAPSGPAKLIVKVKSRSTGARMAGNRSFPQTDFVIERPFEQIPADQIHKILVSRRGEDANKLGSSLIDLVPLLKGLMNRYPDARISIDTPYADLLNRIFGNRLIPVVPGRGSYLAQQNDPFDLEIALEQHADTYGQTAAPPSKSAYYMAIPYPFYTVSHLGDLPMSQRDALYHGVYQRAPAPIRRITLSLEAANTTVVDVRLWPAVARYYRALGLPIELSQMVTEMPSAEQARLSAEGWNELDRLASQEAGKVRILDRAKRVLILNPDGNNQGDLLYPNEWAAQYRKILSLDPDVYAVIVGDPGSPRTKAKKVYRSLVDSKGGPISRAALLVRRLFQKHEPRVFYSDRSVRKTSQMWFALARESGGALISVDTGLSHLAAAQGVPLLVYLDESNKWEPVFGRTQSVVVPRGHNRDSDPVGMTEIAYKKMRGILQKRTGARMAGLGGALVMLRDAAASHEMKEIRTMWGQWILQPGTFLSRMGSKGIWTLFCAGLIAGGAAQSLLGITTVVIAAFAGGAVIDLVLFARFYSFGANHEDPRRVTLNRVLDQTERLGRLFVPVNPADEKAVDPRTLILAARDAVKAAEDLGEEFLEIRRSILDSVRVIELAEGSSVALVDTGWRWDIRAAFWSETEGKGSFHVLWSDAVLRDIIENILVASGMTRSAAEQAVRIEYFGGQENNENHLVTVTLPNGRGMSVSRSFGDIVHTTREILKERGRGSDPGVTTANSSTVIGARMATGEEWENFVKFLFGGSFEDLPRESWHSLGDRDRVIAGQMLKDGIHVEKFYAQSDFWTRDAAGNPVPLVGQNLSVGTVLKNSPRFDAVRRDVNAQVLQPIFGIFAAHGLDWRQYLNVYDPSLWHSTIGGLKLSHAGNVEPELLARSTELGAGLAPKTAPFTSYYQRAIITGSGSLIMTGRVDNGEVSWLRDRLLAIPDDLKGHRLDIVHVTLGRFIKDPPTEVADALTNWLTQSGGVRIAPIRSTDISLFSQSGSIVDFKLVEWKRFPLAKGLIWRPSWQRLRSALKERGAVTEGLKESLVYGFLTGSVIAMLSFFGIFLPSLFENIRHPADPLIHGALISLGWMTLTPLAFLVIRFAWEWIRPTPRDRMVDDVVAASERFMDDYKRYVREIHGEPRPKDDAGARMAAVTDDGGSGGQPWPQAKYHLALAENQRLSDHERLRALKALAFGLALHPTEPKKPVTERLFAAYEGETRSDVIKNGLLSVIAFLDPVEAKVLSILAASKDDSRIAVVRRAVLHRLQGVYLEDNRFRYDARDVHADPDLIQNIAKAYGPIEIKDLSDPDPDVQLLALHFLELLWHEDAGGSRHYPMAADDGIGRALMTELRFNAADPNALIWCRVYAEKLHRILEREPLDDAPRTILEIETEVMEQIEREVGGSGSLMMRMMLEYSASNQNPSPDLRASWESSGGRERPHLPETEAGQALLRDHLERHGTTPAQLIGDLFGLQKKQAVVWAFNYDDHLELFKWLRIAVKDIEEAADHYGITHLAMPFSAEEGALLIDHFEGRISDEKLFMGMMKIRESDFEADRDLVQFIRERHSADLETIGTLFAYLEEHHVQLVWYEAAESRDQGELLINKKAEAVQNAVESSHGSRVLVLSRFGDGVDREELTARREGAFDIFEFETPGLASELQQRLGDRVISVIEDDLNTLASLYAAGINNLFPGFAGTARTIAVKFGPGANPVSAMHRTLRHTYGQLAGGLIFRQSDPPDDRDGDEHQENPDPILNAGAPSLVPAGARMAAMPLFDDAWKAFPEPPAEPDQIMREESFGGTPRLWKLVAALIPGAAAFAGVLGHIWPRMNELPNQLMVANIGFVVVLTIINLWELIVGAGLVVGLPAYVVYSRSFQYFEQLSEDHKLFAFVAGMIAAIALMQPVMKIIKKLEQPPMTPEEKERKARDDAFDRLERKIGNAGEALDAAERLNHIASIALARLRKNIQEGAGAASGDTEMQPTLAPRTLLSGAILTALLKPLDQGVDGLAGILKPGRPPFEVVQLVRAHQKSIIANLEAAVAWFEERTASDDPDTEAFNEVQNLLFDARLFTEYLKNEMERAAFIPTYGANAARREARAKVGAYLLHVFNNQLTPIKTYFDLDGDAELEAQAAAKLDLLKNVARAYWPRGGNWFYRSGVEVSEGMILPFGLDESAAQGLDRKGYAKRLRQLDRAIRGDDRAKLAAEAGFTQLHTDLLVGLRDLQEFFDGYRRTKSKTVKTEALAQIESLTGYIARYAGLNPSILTTGARMAVDPEAVLRGRNWLWHSENDYNFGRFRQLIIKYKDVPGIERILARLDPQDPEFGKMGKIEGIMGELLTADRLVEENPGAKLMHINLKSDVSDGDKCEIDLVLWSDRETTGGLKQGVNFVEVKTSRNPHPSIYDTALHQIHRAYDHTYRFRAQGFDTHYLVAVYVVSDHIGASEVRPLESNSKFYTVDLWTGEGRLHEPSFGAPAAMPEDDSVTVRMWCDPPPAMEAENLRERIRSLIVERSPDLAGMLLLARKFRFKLAAAKSNTPAFNVFGEYQAFFEGCKNLSEKYQDFPIHWQRWGMEMLFQTDWRIASERMEVLRSDTATPETRQAAITVLESIASAMGQSSYTLHSGQVQVIREMIAKHRGHIQTHRSRPADTAQNILKPVEHKQPRSMDEFRSLARKAKAQADAALAAAAEARTRSDHDLTAVAEANAEKWMKEVDKQFRAAQLLTYNDRKLKQKEIERRKRIIEEVRTELFGAPDTSQPGSNGAAARMADRDDGAFSGGLMSLVKKFLSLKPKFNTPTEATFLSTASQKLRVTGESMHLRPASTVVKITRAFIDEMTKAGLAEPKVVLMTHDRDTPDPLSISQLTMSGISRHREVTVTVMADLPEESVKDILTIYVRIIGSFRSETDHLHATWQGWLADIARIVREGSERLRTNPRPEAGSENSGDTTRNVSTPPPAGARMAVKDDGPLLAHLLRFKKHLIGVDLNTGSVMEEGGPGVFDEIKAEIQKASPNARSLDRAGHSLKAAMIYAIKYIYQKRTGGALVAFDDGKITKTSVFVDGAWVRLKTDGMSLEDLQGYLHKVLKIKPASIKAAAKEAARGRVSSERKAKDQIRRSVVQSLVDLAVEPKPAEYGAEEAVGFMTDGLRALKTRLAILTAEAHEQRSPQVIAIGPNAREMEAAIKTLTQNINDLEKELLVPWLTKTSIAWDFKSRVSAGAFRSISGTFTAVNEVFHAVLTDELEGSHRRIGLRITRMPAQDPGRTARLMTHSKADIWYTTEIKVPGSFSQPWDKITELVETGARMADENNLESGSSTDFKATMLELKKKSDVMDQPKVKISFRADGFSYADYRRRGQHPRAAANFTYSDVSGWSFDWDARTHSYECRFVPRAIVQIDGDSQSQFKSDREESPYAGLMLDAMGQIKVIVKDWFITEFKSSKFYKDQASENFRNYGPFIGESESKLDQVVVPGYQGIGNINIAYRAFIGMKIGVDPESSIMVLKRDGSMIRDIRYIGIKTGDRGELVLEYKDNDGAQHTIQDTEIYSIFKPSAAGARMAGEEQRGDAVRPKYLLFDPRSMPELAAGARAARLTGSAPVLLPTRDGARLAYTVVPADAGESRPEFAAGPKRVAASQAGSVEIAGRMARAEKAVIETLVGAGLLVRNTVTEALPRVEVVAAVKAEGLGTADLARWREAAVEQFRQARKQAAGLGILLSLDPDQSDRGVLAALGGAFDPVPRLKDKRIYLKTPEMKSDPSVLNFYMEPTRYENGEFLTASLAATVAVAGPAALSLAEQLTSLRAKGKPASEIKIPDKLLTAWGILLQGDGRGPITPNVNNWTAYQVLLGTSQPQTNAQYASRAWHVGPRLAALIAVLRLGARMAQIAA